MDYFAPRDNIDWMAKIMLNNRDKKNSPITFGVHYVKSLEEKFGIYPYNDEKQHTNLYSVYCITETKYEQLLCRILGVELKNLRKELKKFNAKREKNFMYFTDKKQAEKFILEYINPAYVLSVLHYGGENNA